MKLIIIFLVLYTNNCFADFDESKWGMNLNELKTVYQNGKSSIPEKGIVEYSTPVNIVKFPKSTANFILQKDKLISVILDLGLKQNESECINTFNSLRSDYINKYGAADYQSENVAAWNIKYKESFMITKFPRKTTCIPAIVYFDRPIVINGNLCKDVLKNHSCKEN